eukprot:6210051-Pleurochrysis_carterae.AAC.1
MEAIDDRSVSSRRASGSVRTIAITSDMRNHRIPGIQIMSDMQNLGPPRLVERDGLLRESSHCVRLPRVDEARPRVSGGVGGGACGVEGGGGDAAGRAWAPG